MVIETRPGLELLRRLGPRRLLAGQAISEETLRKDHLCANTIRVRLHGTSPLRENISSGLSHVAPSYRISLFLEYANMNRQFEYCVLSKPLEVQACNHVQTGQDGLRREPMSTLPVTRVMEDINCQTSRRDQFRTLTILCELQALLVTRVDIWSLIHI